MIKCRGVHLQIKGVRVLMYILPASVAQLDERPTGRQEDAGSTPPGR